MNTLENYPFLQPFLWSYDIAMLDRDQHKQTIIMGILNWGDRRATDWLRKTYTPDEIRKAISASAVSEWDKKSLTFWSLLYRVSPSRTARFA